MGGGRSIHRKQHEDDGENDDDDGDVLYHFVSLYFPFLLQSVTGIHKMVHPLRS